MSDLFRDNKDAGRYELEVDGALAFARYRIKGDTLYIDYVEAPEVLRGTGAAGRLMERIVALSKEHNLSIEPICGYAAAWLRRHS